MPRPRKLIEPITLKDGRVLKSVADARAFMLALPERRQMAPYWQYAAELLLKAATRSSKEATLDAWAQLRRALNAEGML
ncbi:hypothetical protein SAMN05444161_7510 [Rhizobiales bacterium GAS191]|nr:hypothetical protein SAMN05444161_7510 [Rhizobiales bacterium GAS191]